MRILIRLLLLSFVTSTSFAHETPLTLQDKLTDSCIIALAKVKTVEGPMNSGIASLEKYLITIKLEEQFKGPKTDNLKFSSYVYNFSGEKESKELNGKTIIVFLHDKMGKDDLWLFWATPLRKKYTEEKLGNDHKLVTDTYSSTEYLKILRQLKTEQVLPANPSQHQIYVVTPAEITPAQLA